MPRLSLWNPTKTKDFEFIDRIVGEHIYAGGTGVHIHKYLGIQDSPASGDPTRPGGSDNNSEVFIQDLLFLENRDRKYSKDIFELRAQYNLGDNDSFDLTQFGMFLANDTLYFNFHTESMVEAIGRRLMPGDVLEIPHLRDDLLLGSDDAINRYFVITDATRPAEGYDARWWSHLWRCKVGPITDSQEYRDILGTGEEESDLRNLISKYKDEIIINDKILEQAEKDIPNAFKLNSDHLYVEESTGKPGVGFNSGQVPNGVSVVGSGGSFPASGVSNGDYFLRTDFSPHRLFKKDGTRWLNVGSDYSGSWSAANRLLETFVNNDTFVTYSDGEVAAEKTNLSKAVKPKTDN
jgi:hypothetical protein